MSSIVVTGAASFIGRQFTEKAIAEGNSVTAVVRAGTAKGRICQGVNIASLNMDEYGKIGELTGGCDCFLHLAWSGTRGNARMDADLQRQNMEFSLSGVKAMLSCGCKKIVLAGSQAEYGPNTDKITEETPCVPNTEYGKNKLALYRAAADLCGRFGAKCFEPRFFSLYGPGDYSGTLIASMLENMLANKPCELTQGVQMWDFLYVSDAVSALYELCARDCGEGVYNFGSGDVRQLRDYVEEMARITKTTGALCFGTIPYPASGMVSLWPDIEKLRRETGWSPQVSFDTGIRTIIKTMKPQGKNEEVR